MSYEESFKLYNEARALVAKGQLEAAVPLFEKSNALYSHFKTLELWGECEIKLGNFSRAIAPLVTAIELNSSIKPKSLLAQAYMKVGQQNEAIELAKEVLETASNNKIAKSILSDKSI